MPDSDLANTLEQLGLSGHEPAVYAALLERSPAGAAWIAKRCGLSRAFVFEDAWRAKVRRFKHDKQLTTRLLVNRSPIERRHAAYYASRRDTVRRYLRVPVARFGLYLCGDTAAILSLDASHLLGVRIV